MTFSRCANAIRIRRKQIQCGLSIREFHQYDVRRKHSIFAINFVRLNNNFAKPSGCKNFSANTVDETSYSRPRTTGNIESFLHGTDEVWQRDELIEETARLLRVLGPPENHTKEDGVMLSQTKFEDVDRVMEAWSKRAAVAGRSSLSEAEQAESLLLALERNMTAREAEDGSSARKLIPDTVSYNRVLHAYAVSRGGLEAAKHAQNILDRMLQQCNNFDIANRNIQLKPPEPSRQTFNTVINAWAKSGDRDSGIRAEEVFTKMEEWYHDCHEEQQGKQAAYNGVLPNSRTLSAVMDAWAQNRGNKAAERVFTILQHMVEKRRRLVRGEVVEGTVVLPNIILFNSAIHAWVNSNRGEYAAQKAQEILRMLEDLDRTRELDLDRDDQDEEHLGLKANTRTMSLVIDAWARCEDPSGKAAQRAQDILDRMERLYECGYDLRPNYVSFTSCITAWARSRDVIDSAKRAEDIFDRMLKLSVELQDADLRPTTNTANAVITAWARSRSRDSVVNAERVFEKLEQFGQADTYSYNSMLDAYAKKGWARLAERLLEKMERSYREGRQSVRPNLVTYNSVLNAIAKSDQKAVGAKKAEALLVKMECMENGTPDIRSYSTVIDCWAKSGDPLQAVNADNIMKRILELYKTGNGSVGPDAFAFSRLIMACANTKGDLKVRRDALKIALQAFEDLKQSPQFGSPDCRTYSSIMTAISRCSSDEEEAIRLLKAVFKQCCNAGQVNKVVFQLFLQNVPLQSRVSILKPLDGHLPIQWSENVMMRERPRLT